MGQSGVATPILVGPRSGILQAGLEAQRLHLPFPVLSDDNYEFQKALKLPAFQAAGMTLLKRVTLIARAGHILAVHYPVFPSDSDPQWVIERLVDLSLKS